jgi:amidase
MRRPYAETGHDRTVTEALALLADVRHPHDPLRTPGGSSTGEAVVVASGASPLGIGSDSGGSVRLPAAWCGVFGFKPTAGRVPTTGHYPRVGGRSDGRTQIGPLARELAMIELVLPLIAGPDGRDAGVAPVPYAPTGPATTFAVLTAEGEITADALTAAAERAADALEHAGVRRVEWTGPWLADALDVTQRYWNRSGLSGADADRQLRDWDRFCFRYLAAAADVDLLLTPTVRTPAPAHRPVVGDDFVFTLPASLTGSPAISVPVDGGSPGMPLSVQLVGRPWEDARVLAAACLVTRPTA